VIIAVAAPELAGAAAQALAAGAGRLLVEKPAGLTADEIRRLRDEASRHAAAVFVAYNRRFYASVGELIARADADGGITSFAFEFTEWSHRVEQLSNPVVRSAWFLANSTHVVDLAFFIGGDPKELTAYTAGGIAWHPEAAIFAGAGRTTTGALFSYQANWLAPGRWALEAMTARHRFILRPLEQLRIQKLGSVEIALVPIDDSVDLRFKPGLLRQVEAFLGASPDAKLCTIADHADRVDRVFARMLRPSR
jgi:predicted dehydrogenase